MIAEKEKKGKEKKKANKQCKQESAGEVLVYRAPPGTLIPPTIVGKKVVAERHSKENFFFPARLPDSRQIHIHTLSLSVFGGTRTTGIPSASTG